MAVVLAVVVAGCASDADDSPEPFVPPTAAGDTTTTSTTSPPTTTTTTLATTTAPASTTTPTTTTLPPTTALPSSTAAPTTVASTTTEAGGGAPGALCDPAAGDPDCTDDTVDGSFRIVEGFAQCLADFDGDTGICSDLNGDGYAGYPDSG